MTSYRTVWLAAKVASEGYCCVHGYLRLCRARGESPKDMAENIGNSPHTIWYNYRKLAAGTLHCQNQSDCMLPIIKEIEKNPPKRV